MHRRFVGLIAAIALFGWSGSARADLASDVAAALGQSDQAQKIAAISALATTNASNIALFKQLASLVSAGITAGDAGALAGALAAACSTVPNNAAITQAIVSALVTAYPESGGDIVGAVIGAGCSTQVAVATLQSTLLTAAGQSLSLIPVLPGTNPGTGANLLQQAFVKSLLTTRLGSILDFGNTQGTVQSPTEPEPEFEQPN